MHFRKYFFVVFVILGVAGDEGDLPSFMHVCKRDDPNLTQCTIASVEDLRPYLITGVAEYNIPSLEPLVLKDLFAEEAAGMKMVVSNASAWGCTDFFVRGLSIDLDTLQFAVDVDIPKLRIEAHYSVDGKLLVVPVKGDGNLEANITDVSARAEMQAVYYFKDEIEYLNFTEINLKVNIGDGNVRVENLFNGDKVLLAMINDVVNKNFDVFLKELMPIIEKSLSAVFLQTGNAIVGAFSYNQLFPV